MLVPRPQGDLSSDQAELEFNERKQSFSAGLAVDVNEVKSRHWAVGGYSGQKKGGPMVGLGAWSVNAVLVQCILHQLNCIELLMQAANLEIFTLHSSRLHGEEAALIQILVVDDLLVKAANLFLQSRNSKLLTNKEHATLSTKSAIDRVL